MFADDIGYRLLYAFGKSERDIARYKEGKGVLKTFDGLLIKGLLCYRGTTTLHLTDEIESLKSDPQILKAAPSIIAVSDGKTLLAYDPKEKDTYENRLDRLYCDFAFFYPLMGVLKVHYVDENPADVKAAEKLAKLHDELRAYNDFSSESDIHDLNIFITRLLFCFFAEDTGIFEEGLFTDSIRRYTKPDGTDLSQYLDESFNVMNVSVRRMDVPSIVKQFPYVNGGLFSKHIQIPRMGLKARKIIIECGELDWKEINPDIFGSMIQAVVNPEERANQGMHYTSVPNIMKVINPLFLDDLRGEYNKLNEKYEQLLQLKKIGAKSEKEFYADCRPISRQCTALLERMSKMKFFDPACGSGNFLIITYKSLRFLEMDILALQQKCQAETQSMFVDASVISINQFYGIELLDFPHEVAMLSLWLAEHQMNMKLNESFGVNTKALPLKNITQIVCANACRIDWNKVCPHTKDEEVFVFGNPPYLGSRNQEENHKKDLDFAISELKDYRKLDYISIWFWKATKYIKDDNAKCAFVSTNSITQGEQVLSIWKPIFDQNIQIAFAYTSFEWDNNAKNKAHVIVVIIGISNRDNKQKKLYSNDNVILCDNINGYLSNARNIFIENRREPISSSFNTMVYGSEPREGGFLMLDEYDKEEIKKENPDSLRYVKRTVGSNEYINDIIRYCLWIPNNMLKDAQKNKFIKDRLEKVTKYRLTSKRADTVKYANKPNLFTNSTYKEEPVLVVPVVSSANREYLPLGFVDKDVVVLNSAQTIANCEIVTYGIIESKLHMVWVKAVSGKLKNDIRYSSTLCYNTFPFPKISAEKKDEIKEAAENVLMTREFFVGKTLADLYDPDKMPQELREAHETLDDIVESCYPGYPFANDEARLECLFKMYEKMTKK